MLFRISVLIVEGFVVLRLDSGGCGERYYFEASGKLGLVVILSNTFLCLLFETFIYSLVRNINKYC